MKCLRCQAENRQGRRFCAECGTPLASTCPACGFSNEPAEKFCGGCGASLTPAPATGTFGSPESYTPKHLIEKILTSKAALEGERKQVTVLFADLKGSMELLADRDPEEARKILDPVVERMMEAVHRYEGTVNQVMGDGIMALFGAPLAHEDHAVRACYAALRMQETVKRYAEGVRRTTGIPVQIRVGLNSGEVVVRAIGSDLHMDYTAVGQTTHLAARMEQMATPGSILLTPDTLALAEGFVQITALGPMAVKGLPAPVDVYELTGVSAVRSRLQAAATRGLSRFVGRDAEVEQLRRVLEQAGQGRGQVAAIVGEPGVGKSRMVFELTHSHRVAGWLVLEARSVSYGQATSYLPVIDLLKGYFKISDRDTQRDMREKVTGKIFTLDRTLESTLPALLALLDVPVDDPQWERLDPPQRRQRTLDAMKRLLLREAHVQPLLLVFEDLHWIDSETQALLESLVESLPTTRVLLLVNYRPEYSHGWGNKTYYTRLRLDALPPESARELLDGLLGSDASIQPLKTLLAGNTGGNPLFLEESVRTLVETNTLVGARGAYRLAHPVETVQVPATVQVILASRIDRLPPEEKRLLETAAVIGQDFSFALLQAIANETDETLRRGLDHLHAAEFLYETSLFPDLEYTFKHALTHEVAYGSLLHERRRALHAKIVDAIEALYPDRLTEHVERLGHHALRGEQWEKAAAYLRQAGAKAAERTAHREAVTFLEQALKAVEQLAEGVGTLRRAVDLRLDLRTSLYALGDFKRTFHYLREAEALARQLGDERRQAVAANWLSAHFLLAGEFNEASRWAEVNLALAVRVNDGALRGMAFYHIGRAALLVGDYPRALEAMRSVTDALGDFKALSYSWLTWSLADMGEFEQAIAAGRRGIEIATTPIGTVQTSAFLARALTLRGDAREALPLFERALALAQERDLTFMADFVVTLMGYAKALEGKAIEGADLLDRGLRALAATGYRTGLMFPANLGEALLLAGRVDEAGPVAEEACRAARELNARPSEVWALRLIGEIASHPKRRDLVRAEGSYREALALAADLGMRPLVAHCHLGLGKLFHRTGKRQEAHDHLITATTMYREMEMRFWLEQAEAEMKALA
jgi:class 3 adenylate cyclase/tetratricopeptide (TPR) repeat protein